MKPALGPCYIHPRPRGQGADQNRKILRAELDHQQKSQLAHRDVSGTSWKWSAMLWSCRFHRHQGVAGHRQGPLECLQLCRVCPGCVMPAFGKLGLEE